MFGKNNKSNEIKNVLGELKKSKGKIIIAIQEDITEEVRENIKRALKMKYGEENLVFLEGYTDKYMFELEKVRHGHEFYNLQNRSEEYKEPKNRLPMLATANIYFDDISDDIAKVIDKIDKEHQYILNNESFNKIKI